MNKYIDADLLRKEIERNTPFHHRVYIKNILDLIDYLQQEQPEDIVVIAKIFLDALSKTPYNNKPITDAQIIVRQLLLFLENPKEYNPDAILEQPEVDLDKEINLYCEKEFGKSWDGCMPVGCLELDIMARHFYELGQRKVKEEDK